MFKDLRIYACDIGSPDGGFAWASSQVRPDSAIVVSADIDLLIRCVIAELRRDRVVALGFECPGLIPVPAHSLDLFTEAREYGRGTPWNTCSTQLQWFAGKPVSFAIAGLQTVTWIIKEITDHQGASKIPIRLGSTLPQSGPALFLWEAAGGPVDDEDTDSYPAGAQSPDRQCRRCFDAASAVGRFRDHVLTGTDFSCPADASLSLFGAAILFSRPDLFENCLLRQTCAVLKALRPSEESVQCLAGCRFANDCRRRA